MFSAARMAACAALWCGTLTLARDCDELDLAGRGGVGGGAPSEYGVIPPNPTVPIECDGHLSLISVAMFDQEAEQFAAALADPARGAVTSLNLNFVRANLKHVACTMHPA